MLICSEAKVWSKIRQLIIRDTRGLGDMKIGYDTILYNFGDVISLKSKVKGILPHFKWICTMLVSGKMPLGKFGSFSQSPDLTSHLCTIVSQYLDYDDKYLVCTVQGCPISWCHQYTSYYISTMWTSLLCVCVFEVVQLTTSSSTTSWFHYWFCH